MKKVSLSILLIFLLTMSQQISRAATVTTTFTVTATVAELCSVSATNLNFGAYNPAVADNDNTSTITVTCTLGTNYDIGLSAGSSTDVANRTMLNGANTLDYSLYSDSGRTANWGETVSTDTKAVASATGVAENHTVYGRLPSGQYVTAGSYSDTITVTVTY